jgi:hypothetical protein
MAKEQISEQDSETPLDLAAVVGLQAGSRSVLAEIPGIVLNAERTPSGGLLLSVTSEGLNEPFLLLDEDEFEQLRQDVEDELSELQDAKAAGEISGDVGVLTKLHKHGKRQCRPLAKKIDCNRSKCEGHGKNVRHLACKKIPVPFVKKFLCLCRD